MGARNCDIISAGTNTNIRNVAWSIRIFRVVVVAGSTIAPLANSTIV